MKLKRPVCWLVPSACQSPSSPRGHLRLLVTFSSLVKNKWPANRSLEPGRREGKRNWQSWACGPGRKHCDPTPLSAPASLPCPERWCPTCARALQRALGPLLCLHPGPGSQPAPATPGSCLATQGEFYSWDRTCISLRPTNSCYRGRNWVPPLHAQGKEAGSRPLESVKHRLSP